MSRILAHRDIRVHMHLSMQVPSTVNKLAQKSECRRNQLGSAYHLVRQMQLHFQLFLALKNAIYDVNLGFHMYN